MTFDADTKEVVARDHHLRVEKLVKLLARPCGICDKPIVRAEVGANGKRIPFDVSQLLTQSPSVTIGSDETLWVKPFTATKHTCDPEDIKQAHEEHERRCSEEVARLRANGHVFRSSRMGLDSETPLEFPPYGQSWGDRP